MGAARKYPDELRDRAVRLVLDLVKDQEASVTAACRKVGGELGIKADTLRGWAKQVQIDRGMRPGTTSADAARIRALERENAELRRVNAILRTDSRSVMYTPAQPTATSKTVPIAALVARPPSPSRLF